MPDNAADEVRTRMLEILGQNIRLSAQLRDILKAELDAIEAQDTAALKSLLDAKRKNIEALQSREKARISCCEQAGFKYGRMQMDELCKWCDQNSSLRNRWAEQLDIAARCQKLNDTIGAIIHARRSHISKGLAVLCGTDSNLAIYGRNGTDSSRARPRDLAEA